MFQVLEDLSGLTQPYSLGFFVLSGGQIVKKPGERAGLKSR
jgi:hypothetical protein